MPDLAHLPRIASRYLRFRRLIDMLRLSPLEDECDRAMARRIEHVIADAGRGRRERQGMGGEGVATMSSWRERLGALMQRPSDDILDEMPGGRHALLDSLVAEIEAAERVAKAALELDDACRVHGIRMGWRHDFPSHEAAKKALNALDFYHTLLAERPDA